MDFYDDNSFDLSEDFLTLDPITTDILQQNNENTEFVLSQLNEFMDLNYVSVENMNEFNFECNQRLIWENIIEYEDANIRKPFSLIDTKYDNEVPDDYKITAKYDSILLVIPRYIPKYLIDKYEFLDLSIFEDELERIKDFDKYNLCIKTLNVFETVSHNTISKLREQLFEMFENLSTKDKINKIKEKSYIGMIWNTLLSNLSKGNKEIHNIFSNQNWDFISNFIEKNI